MLAGLFIIARSNDLTPVLLRSNRNGRWLGRVLQRARWRSF